VTRDNSEAEAPHDQKVVGAFTAQAAGYAKLVGQVSGGRNSALAVLDPRPDDVALDVACGTGAMTFQVAPLVRHVTGIDLTPAMLDQARAAQQQKGLSNINWRQSDLYSLPFADGSFSLVFTSAALHHVERPADAFAEMVRVCSPSGRIAVVDLTPAPASADAFNRIEKMRDPSHVRALTHDELLALSRPHRLRLAAAKSYHSEIPFDAVLAISHPGKATIADIRGLLIEDIANGEDRFDLRPRLADGVLYAAYPMSAVAWTA
jgi:ubiquinone/menaquinone biosynthesis C-methylase UbiE